MRHYTAISVLAVGLIAACSPKNKTPLTFSEATVNKTFALSDNADSPKSEVKMQVLYAANNDGRAKLINNAIEEEFFMMTNLTMQQAVDSFANGRGNSYRKDFRELYEKDKNSEERGAWFDNHYDIKTRTEQNADTIVNYIAEIETYEGGAHGLFTKGVINFSTNTGKPVTLTEVLLPGYEKRLNEILLDKLIKQTGSKDINGLKEKGYLYSMDMGPSQYYLINDKGITFIYNQYEIAPYSTGITELNLNWDELEDIIPNHN